MPKVASFLHFLTRNIAQFGPLQLWPSICFDLTGSHCSALGAWWGNSPDSTAIFCSTYYLGYMNPAFFWPIEPVFHWFDIDKDALLLLSLLRPWTTSMPLAAAWLSARYLRRVFQTLRRRLKSSKAVLTVRSVSMRTNEGRKETGMPWAGDQSNELSNLHAHYWVYSALQCAADSSFKQFQQYAFSSVQPCWTCLSL